MNNNKSIRSFILLGQGGATFSRGMLALQEPLSKFGPASVHDWGDYRAVALEISHSRALVAVVGYSLGANALGAIGTQISRPVELGVGYDASRKSGMAYVLDSEYVEDVPNFRRLICYYNPRAWFYGGCKLRLVTSQMFDPKRKAEIVQINSTHLGVPNYPGLHQQTIDAVRELSDA